MGPSPLWNPRQRSSRPARQTRSKRGTTWQQCQLRWEEDPCGGSSATEGHKGCLPLPWTMAAGCDMRLRTGHNRLNAHMFKKLKLAPSPTCNCGQGDQTAEHILQDIPYSKDTEIPCGWWQPHYEQSYMATGRTWKRQLHSSLRLVWRCDKCERQDWRRRRIGLHFHTSFDDLEQISISQRCCKNYTENCVFLTVGIQSRSSLLWLHNNDVDIIVWFPFLHFNVNWRSPGAGWDFACATVFSVPRHSGSCMLTLRV